MTRFVRYHLVTVTSNKYFFLEKLIDIQQIKKMPAFIEPQTALLFSEVPAIGLYPKRVRR
jgi:hypothetical protein